MRINPILVWALAGACIFLNLISYGQKLYGVNAYGGADLLGTIFHYDLNGSSYTVDHSLTYSVYGNQPMTGMVDGGNGKYYGTTQYGGLYNQGIIFEYDTLTGACTRKIDLNSSIGNRPFADMFLFSGKFYGTTLEGGGYDKGVIFEWDPITNIYTKKFDFNGPLGADPMSGFAIFNNKLYGLTSGGGANGKGVIYEYDPVANVYTKKIDLTAANGSAPYSTLLFHNTTFFGTTQTGGVNNKGVIFEWDPVSNIYTKKYDFDGASGASPAYTLKKVTTFSGTKFYGVTRFGGSFGDDGVLYSYNPTTNAYTMLYEFDNPTGTYPSGGLIKINNSLYGVTQLGGTNTRGVIYEWNLTSGSYGVIQYMDQNLGGPVGQLINQSNKLVGLTLDDYIFGGSGGHGGCFTYNLSDSTYSENFYLEASYLGSNPRNIWLSGTKLIGINYHGGSSNGGNIFTWDISTGSYLAHAEFTNGDFWGPVALCEEIVSGKYYGITGEGGVNSQGVIFEYDPVNDTLIARHNFDIVTGYYVQSAPVFHAGKFYGTTSKGGSADQGVIYEWDPVSDIYTVKFEFSGLNGTDPNSSMLYYNGKFYGVTESGGANNFGVLFEWDPITNIYTKRVDFNFTSGTYPHLSQLIEVNGLLYGLMKYGGTSDWGTLYEWDPVNLTFTVKANFSSINAGYPQCNMIEYGGKLYGTTDSQGDFGYGVIFEYNPVGNQLTDLYSFSIPSGIGAKQLILYTPDVSGIDNQPENRSLSVFPNPTNGELRFTGDNTQTPYSLKVYSTAGQLLQTVSNLYSGDLIQIDQPAGLYIVEVSDDLGHHYTFKVTLK